VSNKLELILRKVGRELADYQVARFFKVPEEFAQTPCDFFGYTACGRAILIEAKMVNAPSLKVAGEPGLSAHQWNELCDANRAGALALICWSRGAVVKTFGIDMATMASKERRSIPWDAIPDSLARPLEVTERLRILDHWLPLPATSPR
jgi:hypothetical protein